jgi:uncharacterized protein YlxP (DUF503 family)
VGRDNDRVHAAAVRYELRVPACRSLKAKRAALRPLVEVLRHRYRVSVAEVDHHDAHQRAAIGVAVVSASHRHLRDVLERLSAVVDAAADLELLEARTTWLDEP